MNIFIDTISIPCTLILFNNKRDIIDITSSQIKWNESSTLISIIDNFLRNNNINYNNLDNIVVVNWPWSFTWIRTTILVVNTINYIIKKNITTISYFDLFDNYPIIKTSSKRDSFIKFSSNWDIEILTNEYIFNKLNSNNICEIYWEVNNDLYKGIKILDKIKYENIIKNISYNKFSWGIKFQKLKKAIPLYIKKPNIS